jgi:hypothetical protein
MANEKSVNRGGTYGQEGEIGEDSGGFGQPQDVGIDGRQPERGNLDQRDHQKQQGGVGREPTLEEKQKIQPKHVVD